MSKTAKMMFNGKPYPQVKVKKIPPNGGLVHITNLTDLDCINLIRAINRVLDNCVTKHTNVGVCFAVDKELAFVTHTFDTYKVMSALAYAWEPARVLSDDLDPYFCDKDMHIEHWEGVNRKQRIKFMKFCIEQLEEFMKDRSRTTQLKPCSF